MLLILTLLPLNWIDTVSAASNKALGNEETGSVAVEYLNEERTEAEITYLIHAEPKEPVNVIFLVDASDTGKQSTQEAGAVIAGWSGKSSDMVYAYGSNPVKIITYGGEQTNETNWLETAAEYDANSSLTQIGGEANELTAVDKALEAIQEVKEMNNHPTVIFWALGSSVNKEAELSDKLTELDAALGDNGALVTYQYSKTVSNVLNQFADEAKALEEFYSNELLVSFSKALFDHHEGTMNLTLSQNQTMIEEITEVSAEPIKVTLVYGNTEATINQDKKGVIIQTGDFNAGDTLQVKLKVRLNPETMGPECVFDEQTFTTTYYTGLIDETNQNGSITFPEVVLNKSDLTIRYELGDNVTGTVPPNQSAASGTVITLADASDISKEGYTFGGWIVTEGTYAGTRYSAGESITMPDENITLKPVWGQTGVFLEVGQVEKAPAKSNQIMETAGLNQVLDFSDILINGELVGDKVHSVTFRDELLDYMDDASAEDSRKVTVKDRADIVYARNIAEEGSSVIAYLVEDDKQGFDMYVSAEGGVKAPSDIRALFAQYNSDTSTLGTGWNANLTKIDFAGNFDTSETTTMDALFYGCTGLTTVLGMEQFNTQNVTNISRLFTNCSAIDNIDLSAWDTSNVTTISRLFQGCTSLSNVRLNWSETNTKNFSDISYAFYNCKNLISLADTGIESWVLPNVTEGSAVFYNCTQLQSANLERWNPTKIVNLPWLFYGCENLQEFSLDGWRVPSLLSLQQAFSSCTKLEVIDLSSWTEIHSLNSLYGTFSGCTNVKEIRIPNIKSGFKTMFFYFTFDECTSLELLDISGWILDGCNEKVANSGGAFDLTTVFWGNTYPAGPFTLLADNWEVTVDEVLTNADQKLEVPWYDSRTDFKANVSINNWNLNNTVQDLSGLSRGWSVLGRKDQITELKGWSGLSGVTSMEGMLKGQSRLERVSITEANMPNLTSTANMFSGCTNLTEVDLSGWTGMESPAITGMFTNAPANINLTADNDAIGTAIKEEYEKNTSSVRKTMENAGVKSIGKHNIQRNTNPTEPKYTAEEDTSMYGTIEQPLVKEVNKENNEIRWHEEETPAGTELYLKTTIQYVGDIGAKSEDINLEVVLPQGMVPAQEPEVVIGGFQYIGENTGYRSGTVEAAPTLSTNEAGRTVMTAKVGSMYTGTEIEMSFKVKLEDVEETGQYKLWDVTATTKDKNSTAEDTLRFWEAVTTEGTEYPITIESTGTGQAWTDVSGAAPGTPITVYTQGGTVESITATDSNGTTIDISEAEKVRIAGTMQETNQYTFQMPSAAVTVKVVFAQSQQPQTPGETPQTGNMEGTGGMESPRTGDTNSMVAVIAAVSICAAGVLLYMLSKGKKQR